MFIKGIKKGKNIELLEEINIPENQEVIVEIKEVANFWTALQDFRKRVDLDSQVFLQQFLIVLFSHVLL